MSNDRDGDRSAPRLPPSHGDGSTPGLLDAIRDLEIRCDEQGAAEASKLSAVFRSSARDALRIVDLCVNGDFSELGRVVFLLSWTAFEAVLRGSCEVAVNLNPGCSLALATLMDEKAGRSQVLERLEKNGGFMGKDLGSSLREQKKIPVEPIDLISWVRNATRIEAEDLIDADSTAAIRSLYELRNSLVHDAGRRPVRGLQEAQYDDDGRVILDEAFLQDSARTMLSVASRVIGALAGLEAALAQWSETENKDMGATD